MIYSSEMPKIVGEFDAEELHGRIDQIVAEFPDSKSYDIQRHLSGDEFRLMKDIVPKRYNRLFRSASYNDFRGGWTDEIYYISAGNDTGVDEWHFDTNGNARIFELTEILTGASRWPTEFLVGRIGVGQCVAFSRHWDLNHRWETEAGRDAIETAIQLGDAQVIRFEPGEMLKVPPGTLHRRNIPEGEEGFRYFVRNFPFRSPLKQGTVLGRLRPR
jgi:hypothetical protein